MSFPAYIPTLTNSVARFSFFLIYLFFFALNLTLTMWSWQRFYATSDMMMELLKELVALYSVQFSVILAAIFGSEPDDNKVTAVAPYIAGVLLVLLWNANTLWPFVYLFMKAGPEGMTLEWALDYWKNVPVMTGFLASAALTFFFLKSSQGKG